MTTLCKTPNSMTFFSSLVILWPWQNNQAMEATLPAHPGLIGQSRLTTSSRNLPLVHLALIILMETTTCQLYVLPLITTLACPMLVVLVSAGACLIHY